jgi:glycosyltransferase involved in cell wall biosynthesis
MRVAVIIPCFNEEITVAKVVADCRKYLPESEVFVFDNNSTDDTATVARTAGAHVVHSPLQGKGHTVRHALRSVKADIYLIVDGDDTYSIKNGPQLIKAVRDDGYEMAVGTRLQNFKAESFRPLHLLGNKLFSLLVAALFGRKISDLFSGYRAISRHLVRRIPLRSSGFEIETEFTLQALASGLPFTEIPTPYGTRPNGSFSKLRTFEDGFTILKFIVFVVRYFKPLMFFSSFSFIFFVCGMFAGWSPIAEYIEFSYVYTLPRAVLAASLMVMSIVSLGVGLILDAQIRHMHMQLDMLALHFNDDEHASNDRKVA